MNPPQWRVLYRQFLFRVFDLELLSTRAEGDAHRLLGQFAALLIWISAGLAFVVLLFGGPASPTPITLVFTMIMQHFLIATTMLVVGLFAVLSWDATFPDKRDVLVLAPLPVRARTMFFAKTAAVATSLGLTVLLLHCIMGLVWPFVFAHQAAPATLPAMTFDPTRVPASASDLKTIMDRDLKQALTTGDLAPGSPISLAIGVIKGGERRVFIYGAAKPDSVFEIGSISKTFTGLMLARMVAQGRVRLDEPIRELLPPGAVAKPQNDETEITLLDLATHHSGLPPVPDNYDYSESHPFESYTDQQLYAWLGTHGVAKPEDTEFVYSNLGVGLLGDALALRAGTTYAGLLRDEITGPLGMADTVVKVPAGDLRRRFLQGYDDKHDPARKLELGSMAGAGEIHSTASDMLAFLEANLHPQHYPTFARALNLSHQLHESANAGQQVALAWAYNPKSRTWWHNGGTSGFTSYAFFNPHEDCAAIVLLNMNGGPTIRLSPDRIGEDIEQRLTGAPALSLDTVLIPATSGFLGLLRQFWAYWSTMLAASLFVYGATLGTQGLASQALPRRLFLRISGYLQIVVVGVIIGVYFLQPGLGGLDDLAAGSIFRLIQWLPSYWFLAFYQQLNGSMHPALAPLAHRAWIGLATVGCGTAAVYTLSYWRTLRKIVEDPDITPGVVRVHWLPRFGNRYQTALGQFTVRTLARSRQHRLILGFYLGIALAFTSLIGKASPSSLSNPWRAEDLLVWSASLVVIVLAAAGTRVAFAVPFDLRANWIFRVIAVRGASESLAASRRALLLLAIAPVWLATAALCLWIHPDRQNAGHLIALCLFGLILADLCLLRFRKIPFTCSWLPGKSHFHLAFICAFLLLLAGANTAMLERHALRKTGSTLAMLALLALIFLCIRLTSRAFSNRVPSDLLFEEEEPPQVIVLGLYRDGVMPIDATRQ